MRGAQRSPTPTAIPRPPKPKAIDPASMDRDAQEAFAAAVEAEVRKRDRKREAAFNERVWKEANQYRKPFRPFTPDEYKAIERCLHPDANPSPERKAEAFRIVRERKDELIKKDPPGGPPKPPPMPSADDMRSRYAARQAKKRPPPPRPGNSGNTVT